MTGKTLNGTTTSIPVTAATNRLTNAYYDLNGNMTSGLGMTMTYDGSNRLFSATPTSGGTEYYAYAPDNKRIYKWSASGAEEWTFYGARGEKIGTYSMYDAYGYGFDCEFQVTNFNVWFGGKLVNNSGGAVDRPGTETVAKIIIYERGLGRENGHWPDFRDGVYVLVRSNGNARHAIWNANLLASNEFSSRLNPRCTLGIAPKHSERFAYFRLEIDDDIQTVAELLLVCAAS